MDGLKLALNFNPSHIRTVDLKSELKCSKGFRALKFRGGDPNQQLVWLSHAQQVSTSDSHNEK